MPPLTKRSAAALPPKETPFARSTRLLEEYRSGLEIDKHGLDDVWLAHPRLVNDVGDEYSLAQSYRDEVEAQVAQESAKADGVVRAKLKDEKPTEGVVKARIALDPSVQAAQEDYRAWKLLTSQWGNLVKAFDSRQYALRVLSDMDARGYWVRSAHKAPGSVSDRVAAQVRRGE